MIERRRLLADREPVRREKLGRPLDLQEPSSLVDAVGVPIGAIAPLTPRARKCQRLGA